LRVARVAKEHPRAVDWRNRPAYVRKCSENIRQNGM
jgi:hypothetical protein